MKDLKLKTIQVSAKEVLTRMQMKNVLGGSGETSGSDGSGGSSGSGGSGGSGGTGSGRGCCAHNADWSVSQCGYSSASEAQSAASSWAQTTGSHGYWCCDSC